MIDPRSICATCGHTREWHDLVRARAQLGSAPGFERPCYREVGGASCRCSGFRDSGDVAVAGIAAKTRGSATTSEARLVRNAALTVLLVLLGLALLYAYRAQAPAVSQIASTEAIAEVQSGQVRRVTIQGDGATLELRTGVKQQTRVPAQSDPLAKAILDYNAAHPGDQVELRYDSETTSFGPIGAVVLSLLPVVLIGGFFYFVMRRAASR